MKMKLIKVYSNIVKSEMKSRFKNFLDVEFFVVAFSISSGVLVYTVNSMSYKIWKVATTTEKRCHYYLCKEFSLNTHIHMHIQTEKRIE